MFQRLALWALFILLAATLLLMVALADLMDERLKRLEQPPTAVSDGVKAA